MQLTNSVFNYSPFLLTKVKNRYAQCVHASTLGYDALVKRHRISDNDKKRYSNKINII